MTRYRCRLRSCRDWNSKQKDIGLVEFSTHVQICNTGRGYFAEEWEQVIELIFTVQCALYRFSEIPFKPADR